MCGEALLASVWQSLGELRLDAWDGVDGIACGIGTGAHRDRDLDHAYGMLTDGVQDCRRSPLRCLSERLGRNEGWLTGVGFQAGVAVARSSKVGINEVVIAK